jgi:hypothetical protein
MDKRAKKLATVYEISPEDAQVLVDAGHTTPRQIKATSRENFDKVNLPKSVRDKVKA